MNLPRWTSLCLSAVILITSISTATARPHQAIDSIDALDEQIVVSLELLAEGDIQQALLITRQLAWRFPEFALGQLIYAELESVSAFQDVQIADHLSVARNVSELLLEAQRRLAATRIEWPGNVVQIGKHLSHMLVMDLQTSVLYQYETTQQEPVLVRQHYIGGGEAGFGKRLEGDLKTPLGVYTITGSRGEDSLPDLYGAGALTLDYPNTLDQYLGRTGHGIWLHGVPSNQLSRTPYSSEGCVTMSNEHIGRLLDELDVSSTRVVLTNNATQLDDDARVALQNTFRELFAQYQRAWINGDETQLFDLYSDRDHILNLLASGNNGFMRINNVELSSANIAPTAASQSFSTSLYQQAFSAIEPEQLSIFSHPDLNDNESTGSAKFITNATFGATEEFQITIYWIQSADGQWRVLTEETEALRL